MARFTYLGKGSFRTRAWTMTPRKKGHMAAYLIAALLVPDRGQMMSGLAQILMSPAQLTKDYFEIGSVSGTFLNVSLVGFVCAAMTCLPGAAVGGGTIAAYFLTTGFSFWGINFLNMWPFFLGVMVPNPGWLPPRVALISGTALPSVL